MKKPLLVIYATVLLDAMGLGLVMPILPGLLHSFAGADGRADARRGVCPAAQQALPFTTFMTTVAVAFAGGMPNSRV